jgi:hypothetical protein
MYLGLGFSFTVRNGGLPRAAVATTYQHALHDSPCTLEQVAFVLTIQQLTMLNHAETVV